MRHLIRIGLPGLVALLALSGVVSAQPQPYIRQSTNPYYTPPLSPYLNMLRGGNPAVNYYLGVVPEFRQRTINSSIAGQMNQRPTGEAPAEQPEMNELLPELAETGHATQFMNASPYFTLNPYLAQTTATNRMSPRSMRRPGMR